MLEGVRSLCATCQSVFDDGLFVEPALTSALLRMNVDDLCLRRPVCRSRCVGAGSLDGRSILHVVESRSTNRSFNEKRWALSSLGLGTYLPFTC